jgi:hypothetical protein
LELAKELLLYIFWFLKLPLPKNLTYKIRVGEGTFAIHLLVSKITPTKKNDRQQTTNRNINWAIIFANLTYKIGVGEGTFAIHLLVSKITPTKKSYL